MDLNKKLEELKPHQLNCNVFDVYSYNGLTMQDLLCQFFTKINECVTTSNETIDLAKWLVNEGLELEVVKKLMTWLEDGTLEDIINVNLFNSLDNKINDFGLQLKTIQKQEASVVMFGAKGDGETDNIKAFNDTVDYCLENNIKKIIIPSGTYKIKDVFKLPSGFFLEGLGEVTIIQDYVNAPVIATKEFYDNTRPYGGTKIININVVGSESNGVNNHGILIWDYYVIIDKCNISRCGGHGIKFTSKRSDGQTTTGNLVESTISNCHIRYTNLTPLYMGEDSNNKITDCTLENIMLSSNEGCECDLYVGSSAGYFINNIHTYGKSNVSVYIRNTYHTNINNIYIENYKNYGLHVHNQVGCNISNVGIKVQDTVNKSNSVVKITKSSLDVGRVGVTINNLNLFNYITSGSVLGLENENTYVDLKVSNYNISGKNVENIIKYGGYAKSYINIMDGIEAGTYTVTYNNTNLKQYQTSKFSGNTEKVITFNLPKMANYSKLIGKISIYGNAYDNGTILVNYSSDVFISAKNTDDELYVFFKTLIESVGFSVDPNFTVNRSNGELTLTFTPQDVRTTGLVLFEYGIH